MGYAVRIAAVVAVAFGVLTIVSGGKALFGGADMGAVVPFVLWFNFIAGFFYVIAGVGLWLRAPWAASLALALAVLSALVLGAFGVHVLRGGAYEARTAVAMTLRTVVWVVIAWVGRTGTR
jgi:hypothetical protein